EARAGVEGFANTIIAYQLLLNLNYLDTNGIKIQFSEDVNTPFVSKEEAFAEIERRLNEGLSALNSAGDAFPFELSDGFAGFDTPATFARFNRALMARVALYQGKWQAALDALAGSFVDPNGDMRTGVYHVYSTGLGDRLNPIFEVPTAPAVKLRAHPDIKANAEPGDLRYADKVLDRSDDPGFNPSPPAANGLVSPLVITVSKSSTDPFPIIRNEELLLIRAEANFRLGNLAAAEADVNAVRAAAGLGPVTLTAENALDQILHERMYSLLMEGHRWIDMRRTGRLNLLPTEQVGSPPQPGKIFDKWPRPIDEVPEGS
ncbi:MAG: RagB/SusD family nutrient uptake outer membrane protein, partial [Bacteroidetes bacterium]